MARKKLYPLRWFKLNADHDDAWWFWVSHDSITSDLVDKDGGGLYGVCVFEKRHVYINCRYPKTTFPETVVHELDHMTMENVGLPEFIEEPIISHVETLKTRLLTQLGFTLPELPDGYSQMVEATRKRRRKRK